MRKLFSFFIILTLLTSCSSPLCDFGYDMVHKLGRSELFIHRIDNNYYIVYYRGTVEVSEVVDISDVCEGTLYWKDLVDKPVLYKEIKHLVQIYNRPFDDKKEAELYISKVSLYGSNEYHDSEWTSFLFSK